MNTLAMVQARDRASQILRDQQEKASALEHRLEVVRDVMQASKPNANPSPSPHAHPRPHTHPRPSPSPSPSP